MKPSDDLKRRLAYDDLIRTWAPTPFANGSVPTGPCLEWGSSGFVEGIVRLYPEFSDDAARMKWDSTSYVYAATIFVRPTFMGWRTGTAIVTARAGDGALRTEWIFGPTSDDPLEPFYTPEPGESLGGMGRHTNELAATAQQTGEFGAFMSGRHPRIRAHRPTPNSFAEPELRGLVHRAQVVARSLPRKACR